MLPTYVFWLILFNCLLVFYSLSHIDHICVKPPKLNAINATIECALLLESIFPHLKLIWSTSRRCVIKKLL